MRTLVDTLHILLCKHPHVYDMMQLLDRKPNLCYYYLEHDIAECDELPDHIKWQEVAEQFKKHMNLKDDKEALNFIRDILRIAGDLKKLVGNNTDRMDFVKEVLR